MLGEILSEVARWHTCVAGHPLLDGSLDLVTVLCLATQGRRTLVRNQGNFTILTGCIILASIFFSFDGVLKVIPASDPLAAPSGESIS